MKTAQLFGWIYIGLVIAIGPVSAKTGKGGGSKPAPQAPTPKPPSLPSAPPADSKAAPPGKDSLVNVNIGISTHERRVIQGYLGQPRPRKTLPKGVAKKAAQGKALPPGWQRKCVPGQILPTAVFQLAQPLPPALIAKLPPPPPGTITVTLEGKVVRLLHATHEILDVFEVNVTF